MGCPTKQNEIQKITLPMELPGNRRSIILVKKINGICPIIARKECTRIIWQGTLIKTSCKIAERKKTTNVAPVLDRPTLTEGK
mmetsp:Transcript_20208/g.43923  ORF Transcript_20208/g.43923 Transcript_20208/m.43923 type:complete len:83 (-) Transcript_20208:2113-2361(-)